MEYLVSTTTYSVGAVVFINRHMHDTKLEKVYSFAVVEKSEDGKDWTEIYCDGELIKKIEK